jgi:hypothetical protein
MTTQDVEQSIGVGLLPRQAGDADDFLFGGGAAFVTLTHQPKYLADFWPVEVVVEHGGRP